MSFCYKKGQPCIIPCGLSVENVSLKKQALLLEEVQELNRANAAQSGHQLSSLDLEAGVPPKDEQPEVPACSLVDYLHEDSRVAVVEDHDVTATFGEEQTEVEKPKEKTEIYYKVIKPVEEDAVETKEEEEEELKVQEGTRAETILSAKELLEVQEVTFHVEEKEVITAR